MFMLGKGLRLIPGHMQVSFIVSVQTFFHGQVTFLNDHRTQNSVCEEDSAFINYSPSRAFILLISPFIHSSG